MTVRLRFTNTISFKGECRNALLGHFLTRDLNAREVLDAREKCGARHGDLYLYFGVRSRFSLAHLKREGAVPVWHQLPWRAGWLRVIDA
jgi:hypothetical protein